jgi:predicted DsbA family dithiol-disulfide isomerase
VVAEAGLDRKRAEAMLDGDEGMDAIKDAGDEARRLRVDSVPFFVVNGKITLSGAQQPEAFIEAFRQAR